MTTPVESNSERHSAIPVTDRSFECIASMHKLPLWSFCGKTILDLGCGASDLQSGLDRNNIVAKVIGISLDHTPTYARYRPGPGLARIIGDVTKLPIKDQSVDM